MKTELKRKKMKKIIPFLYALPAQPPLPAQPQLPVPFLFCPPIISPVLFSELTRLFVGGKGREEARLLGLRQIVSRYLYNVITKLTK